MGSFARGGGVLMYQNGLKINFVGNYSRGYVGEVADETHLARELESAGNIVNKVPRDQWKAYVDGDKPNDDWVLPIEADINIVAKWHHFNDPNYFSKLRFMSKAPVIYWTWDYMDYDGGWHEIMARASDLYLTNEGGRIEQLLEKGIKAYYFPYDVADGEIQRFSLEKKYDVVFTGSYLGQGDRVEWLKKINEKHQIQIFSWNHEEWKKAGFTTAKPAVYGEDFSKVVAQSRILLQFSVNDHCWGYWSNRVGKVFTLGGFLLARYSPGMELFLRDGCDYFSSPQEAISKIKFYLENETLRNAIAARGSHIGRDRFTSKARVKELLILIDRLLSEGNE